MRSKLSVFKTLHRSISNHQYRVGMRSSALLVVLIQLVVPSSSFRHVLRTNRFKLERVAEKIPEPVFEDPNFEAHLPSFIKVGRYNLISTLPLGCVEQ
jgi:hypothetical protein